LLQFAWLWLRHQPESALSHWFKERVTRSGGHLKKTTIGNGAKAAGRTLEYVTAGVVIDRVVMKTA
jgi:transposase